MIRSELVNKVRWMGPTNTGLSTRRPVVVFESVVTCFPLFTFVFFLVYVLILSPTMRFFFPKPKRFCCLNQTVAITVVLMPKYNRDCLTVTTWR